MEDGLSKKRKRECKYFKLNFRGEWNAKLWGVVHWGCQEIQKVEAEFLPPGITCSPGWRRGIVRSVPRRIRVEIWTEICYRRVDSRMQFLLSIAEYPSRYKHDLKDSRELGKWFWSEYPDDWWRAPDNQYWRSAQYSRTSQPSWWRGWPDEGRGGIRFSGGEDPQAKGKDPLAAASVQVAASLL